MSKRCILDVKLVIGASFFELQFYEKMAVCLDIVVRRCAEEWNFGYPGYFNMGKNREVIEVPA